VTVSTRLTLGQAESGEFEASSAKGNQTRLSQRRGNGKPQYVVLAADPQNTTGCGLHRLGNQRSTWGFQGINRKPWNRSGLAPFSIPKIDGPLYQVQAEIVRCWCRCGAKDVNKLIIKVTPGQRTINETIPTIIPKVMVVP